MDQSKILVVDDEEEIVSLLKERLTANSYKVITAYNGTDALVMVDKEQPDLVILDVMMPKMNGYEVCRTMKSSKASSAIPVILLTALGMIPHPQVESEIGADAYLSKPCESQKLLDTIETLLWD